MALGGLAIPYSINPFISLVIPVVQTVTVVGAMELVVSAETPAPVLAMEMVSGGVGDIAAETKPPTLTMTFSNGLALNILTETATPSMLMGIVQDLAYAITGSTEPPILVMTLSAPELVVAAGETTAWCVNMANGAHSRYTNYPDASEVSAIPAFVLTPVSDFGDIHEKYVQNIYIQCRLPDNGLTVDTKTDEWIERTGYSVEPCDNVQGLTRRRRALAKNVKGQHWQFRLNNVDGGGFTIKSLDVVVDKSHRRV